MQWLERQRWLRAVAPSLPCTFSFLLLFSAGGLVLFIHLQDLSEMAQHEIPGMKMQDRSREDTRKDQCLDHKNSVHSDPHVNPNPDTDVLSSAVAPLKFPASDLKPEVSLRHVTPRRRHLLLKSTPQQAGLVRNSSLSSWEHHSHIQASRKKLMRDVCAKYRSAAVHSILPQHVSRVFVEDKHRLLYCEVPKAGCSNWKRVLMVLQGLSSSTHDIKHEAVHYGNHLRRLDSFNRNGILRRLQNYTKVLFVREPLERLVSAFRDKFESPNNYYHPVFGRPIISRYRANASPAALRTGAGVTFKEFIQYLLDVHRPVGMDIHWEPVGRLCNPCLLDFDFVGRFENLEEDANFLLQHVGAPPNLTFPSFKDRNPRAERTSARITQQYFAQLNASERQRVYDFYYMDYLMFNYSKPFIDVY